MADTTETAIYKLRVEGEDQIKSLQKSIADLAVTEDKAADSTRKGSDEIQKRLARSDPLLKAQQQYTKQLEFIYSVQERGVGTQAEINALMEANTGHYQKQVAAIQQAEKATVAHGNATKASRYEMINLGRQAQDVAVSLAGGQSPFMVLIQQGSQVYDVFASSERKMVDIFKSMGAGIVSFVTNPITLAIGVVGGLTAAALAAANAMDKLQVSSQRAVSGAGARTGTSVEDINKFVAQTSSGRGGTGLSDTEARQLAEGFTKGGDVVIGKLHDMGTAVVGFANQTGKSVDDAIKAFDEFGKDPVKALTAFGDAFGPLSDNAQKAFEAALALGDKTAQLNVILDANAEATRKAAENMGFFEKAARFFQTSIWGGETQKPLGIATQIENAKKALDALIASADNMPAGLGTAMLAADIGKATDALIALQAQQEKAAAQTLSAQNAISAATSMAHKASELQLPVIQAITGATKMTAQFAADYYNALDQAKRPADALVIAADKLAASQAAAVAAAQQGTRQLEDQNELAKAQNIQQEKRIAVAQAYKKVIEDIGDNVKGREEAEKRVDAVTESYRIRMQKAAESAGGLKDEMVLAVNAAGQFSLVMKGANGELQNAVGYAGHLSNLAANLGKSYDESGFGVYPAGSQSSYTQPGAGTGGSQMDFLSAPGQMTSGGSFAGGGGYSFRGGGRGQNIGAFGAGAGPWDPEAYRQEQLKLATDAVNAQVDLIGSVDKLKTSTDSLNRTNQELLSPYYTQDPRTSHIGFRSQGMATGGYVDVPGGYSANDNMTAIIPVASGERIYVDPQSQKRGTGGSGIMINMPVTIQGNANKDEVGRTMYQVGQTMAKQLAAASR